MKRIFTFLLSAFIVTMVMGQAPEAVIKKATVSPVIDGEIDDVWADVEPNLIDKKFGTETPTLGDPEDTWWKALWDDNGIYILVNVKDDIWAPAFGASNSYLYDKIEIYFDVNYLLKDGGGPLTDANGGGNGHYQFAPDVVADSISGGYASSRGGNGSRYSFNVADPEYFAEFFIPFTKLLDNQGNMVDKTAPIGFDVTVTDNDVPAPGGVRNRNVWANTGAITESWGNMDDCGTITLDGVPTGIDIESITIAGDQAITTDNGTVQLTATITPVDATQSYKWMITEGEKIASISSTGLLKAIRENGTVKVKAQSADGFTNSNELTITISNQAVSLEEISIIKNGRFNQGAGNVEFWGRNPAASWMVEDGWLIGTAVPKAEGAEIWDIMVYQAVDVDATTKYIIKFTAKASSDMTVPFITEDINHDYNKEVTSASPYRKETQWDIPVTTEAQTFELDVVHSEFVENSRYQPSFQIGKLTGTVSVKDIYMYAEADLALVTGTKKLNANSFNVFPNPVANILNVDLKGINSKVAIYNSLGQKLMEKTSTGSRLTFDVSSLRKGLYFVKLDDGTTQKFVK